MEYSIFILLLCSAVGILLVRLSSVDAQQIKTVIAGEPVEFSCSLSESLPPGDVSWQIRWDNSDTPVIVNAEATSSLEDPVFRTGHGEYRTIYRSERRLRYTHYCTLIIEHIQLGDAGRYSCKHVGNFRDRGIFSEHELRVLPRPPDDDLPQCSHSMITQTSEPQNDRIQLSCQFSGGNPPAQLVWYKDGLQLGQVTENSNTMEYQLTPSDNGVEFSCHAMSPALSETSYCHLTPLEVPPRSTLTPLRVTATPGADVTFTCSGEGLPFIDRIEWYVDGISQGDSSRGVIQTPLEKNANISYLTLYDLQDGENGMDVMCEVAVPSGLTADSLARIEMIRESIDTTPERTAPMTTLPPMKTTTQIPKRNPITKQSKTSPAGKTTHKRVLIPDGKSENSKQDASPKKKGSGAPVAASIIVLICIIVIVIIIVVVVKKRRRNPRKKMYNPPDSPTGSLPAAHNPIANEFANNMYEGTIFNTSQRDTQENFYHTAPLEEDPGKTWSTYEGSGIWQDENVHHYENTAIGCPIPTFARQNNNLKNMGTGEEKEKMLHDIAEKEGDTF